MSTLVGKCEQAAASDARTLDPVSTTDTITRSSGSRGPHRRSRFGVRSVAGFVGRPLSFLQRLAEEHGDVVELTMLGRPWTLLFHPDDIEDLLVGHAADLARDDYSNVLKRVLGEGLLTSDGELWKKQRRLASAAFTPKRIREYAEAMSRVTDQGLARWKDGERVQLHEEMSHLTLEVVADVLFGASVSKADVDTVRESMEVFNVLFAQSAETVLRIPTWVPTPLNRAAQRAVERLDGLIARIVETRRRSGERRNDVLDALLTATDEDGTKMNDKQLRDEVVTLFLAGHETTALALTYTLRLLATHPEKYGRMLDEVDGVLAGRAPTQADAERLPFTSAIVREGLRLYPPVWSMARHSRRDLELAGVPIRANMQVILSQWVVQRDARWFREPERFRPERWLGDECADLPRFAYFPFGGGPRVCIGQHFALLELVLVLARLSQTVTFEPSGDELVLSPVITLRPKGPVRLRVRRRAHAGSNAA